MGIRTRNLGYPRIGRDRELKKATEAYWKGELSLEELKATGATLRRENWLRQRDAGIDLIPSNDFSFYDQVLDLSCLVGNIPERHRSSGDANSLDTLFAIARGNDHVTASEMTKWFDTNYHYIVPEFSPRSTFALSTTKVFDEFEEALQLGIQTVPVLIGPVTYLSLGKVHDSGSSDFQPLDMINQLLPVYEEILQGLADRGAEWVQLDEPILSTDLDGRQRSALLDSYRKLSEACPTLKLILANYFGPLEANLDLFLSLPVDAYHVDVVRGESELSRVLAGITKNGILSLGIVDGRNVWKNSYAESVAIIEKAREQLDDDRLWLAPSCSLLHAPISLDREENMDEELRTWLAFADEKLAELQDLSDIASGHGEDALQANREAVLARKQSPLVRSEKVQTRVANISEQHLWRSAPYSVRRDAQRGRLGLPPLPTTTIGSFPQTAVVRKARASYRRGELSEAEYEAFLREETRKCIRTQEEVGLDVLVHGEFERTDMVEYFGEQLDGFAFTQHAWVQSYGSRYVKPPIIFGDVSRPAPMTVRWSSFAQSLTEKPVKGMLTGPITILQWSFVRNDQPERITAQQIALAIRDEVTDLEAAGISIIQIDEPALREGLPLRKSDWRSYLDWAVSAFKLSACGVRDETQIHTHMCYAEFNDIIASIAALDADVISMETSRSNLELLFAFKDYAYPNEIGPGVYDIHSPRIPTTDEITELIQRLLEVLPADQLWINPDCGLKTRTWDEVVPALRNMVAATNETRATLTATA